MHTLCTAGRGYWPAHPVPWPMPRLLPSCLAACLVLSAALPLQARPAHLVVANIALPESVWPSRREQVLALLTRATPDVLVVQDVHTQGKNPLEVCSLAQPLRMHCDFVSADPPSQQHRRGTALLSARPVVEDGATLLHAQDGSAPVAAGYLRLLVGQQQVRLYTASLVAGQQHHQRRLRQAADLRNWMASHAPAPTTLIAGRFGSQHAELQQLMPGLRAARRSAGTAQAHGLDVLYQNQQTRLHALTLLELQAPPPVQPAADAPAMPAPAPLLLGLVVELELPQQPSGGA